MNLSILKLSIISIYYLNVKIINYQVRKTMCIWDPMQKWSKLEALALTNSVCRLRCPTFQKQKKKGKNWLFYQK